MHVDTSWRVHDVVEETPRGFIGLVTGGKVVAVFLVVLDEVGMKQ